MRDLGVLTNAAVAVQDDADMPRRWPPDDLSHQPTPVQPIHRPGQAAKAEREGEGRELVTQDHGEGKTPGAGGRGIF